MLPIKIESIISPWNKYRHESYCEPEVKLKSVQIGKSYPDFCMFEDIITDYDIPLTEVKKGDVIIQDYQFGHVKRTGYTPALVVDVLEGHSVKVDVGSGQIVSLCADPYVSNTVVYHKLKKSAVVKGSDDEINYGK